MFVWQLHSISCLLTMSILFLRNLLYLIRLFNGPITAGIPATLLRHHPNAYVLTTEKVAKEAKIIDYVSSIKEPKEAARWIVEGK